MGQDPGSAELEGVAEFVDDLASLAELQAKLAAADFKDAARRSAAPIVLTVVGLTVVVASLPVALFGEGWLLGIRTKHRPGSGHAPDGYGGDDPRRTGGGLGREMAQPQFRQLPPFPQTVHAEPDMGPDRACHQRAPGTGGVDCDH